MIRISNVTIAFGRTLAIDGLDLELRPGITGLFGPNASGKSTLLRSVVGLLTPTTGTITWNDVSLTRAPEEVRRRIGYAGHDSGLYARLSVEENLRLFARLFDAPGERVEATITRLGLVEERATRVRELSAGFKRRAAVARAMLHGPHLLVLDEPYANLDDDASEFVSTAVREWRENHPDGIALIATHGAKKLKAYADAGAILQRGRLVRYGDYKPAAVAR